MLVSIYYKLSLFNAHAMILICHISTIVTTLCLNHKRLTDRLIGAGLLLLLQTRQVLHGKHGSWNSRTVPSVLLFIANLLVYCPDLLLSFYLQLICVHLWAALTVGSCRIKNKEFERRQTNTTTKT